MALLTLADIKTYLGITDSLSDAILTKILEGAESALWSEIWCDLTQQTYTEYHNGAGTRALVLKKYPVASFTSFEYNTWTPSAPVWTPFDEDSYVKEEDKGMIQYLTWILPRWYKNIKVVYEAWYTTGNMPSAIMLALYKLVDGYWQQKGIENISSEKADDVMITYRSSNESTSWQNEVTRLLSPYKRYV